jgi:hypothetical protein
MVEFLELRVAESVYLIQLIRKRGGKLGREVGPAKNETSADWIMMGADSQR